MKLLSIFFILLFPAFLLGQEASKLELPSLICDNMVLQQKATVKLWGKAKAGQIINVNASWKASVKATTDVNGNWMATIQTPAAGGPYTINISAPDKSLTIQNVLIGEVWFCSGQSNMEMPMAGWPPNDTILGSAREIAAANNNKIRLFNVLRGVSFSPEENCTGKWEVCSPSTVSTFSATAYFFGKKLYQHLQVPIGLIESAWGGTPVESWISAKSLRDAGEFVDVLNKMEESKPMQKEFMTWLTNHEKVTVSNNQFKNLDFKDAACASKDFDDSQWSEMKLPQKWEESSIGEFDGVVWYRKKVTIPAEMQGKDLVLSLGPIDDIDRTYVNGNFAGGLEELGYWQAVRKFKVPASAVGSNEVCVAIRVIDTQGGGGLWGKDDQVFLAVKDDETQKISLAGNWKYLPVAEWIDYKFYLYSIETREFFIKKRPMALSPFTASTLYNAMVSPVLNYHIKGAIWYQGEANVGRAEQYSKTFPLMIQDWRKSWGIPDFPFYYVQIAPWAYDGGQLDSTSSAYLRESQLKAMLVPNTGMAVTMDIATVYNIHPPDKTNVGERLARWALAKNYNVKIPYSGPVYKSMEITGNTIKLNFDYAESGLKAKEGGLKEFRIAGADGKYVPAKAEIVGKQVVVSSPEVPSPVSVRYCWRNGAEGTLFNGEGLPASSFRTR
jgi:sialate O-acetylesterase